MEFITYFTSNWDQILLAITSAIGTASLVVKLTPTPKDDAILGKIKGFLSKYIALNK